MNKTKNNIYFTTLTTLLSVFLCSCSNQIAIRTEENPDKMIHGFTAKGFEPVTKAFTQNFLDGNEIGAALCIYYKGEKVVDVWGGYRDEELNEYWQENTMALTYSMTKGLASLCIAKLHSEDLVDYDQKVAYYWPGFAKNGKENITVRQLLSHQSGLCLWEGSIPVGQLNDSLVMIEKLENAVPLWTPGERNGYSAGMVGAYIRELVRRLDPQHRTFGTYFQQEIAQPLHGEFYIGLPDSISSERIAYNKVLGVWARIGSLFKLPWGMFTTVINPWSLFMKSITQVEGYDVNDRNTWRMEEPSGNGIGTAHGAALIYSEFSMGGDKLNIRKETLDELTGQYIKALKGSKDKVMGVDMYYRNGFIKNGEKNKPFANNKCFGFGGASGSMAFADPVNKIGYCYIPNLMGDDFPDSRNENIQNALYECLTKVQHLKNEE